VPKEFRDYTERLVTPGCFILYATSQGSSSVQLHAGKVLSLEPPGSNYDRWRIKIAAVDRWKKGKAYRATLSPYAGGPGCCIVIVEPQNVPKKYMDILDKEN